jgi:precorrin-6B methylase 2
MGEAGKRPPRAALPSPTPAEGRPPRAALPSPTPAEGRPPRAALPSPTPAEGRLRYIGDISRQDAELLRHYASGAKRILEFGSGASTQVLAQCSHPDSIIASVEPDPEWIAMTQKNFDRLGISRTVRFILFKAWKKAAQFEAPFDLIFDDGVDKLRRGFAESAWPLLKVGGHMLFHDTRRIKDLKNVLSVVEAHFLEVESVQLNEASSNITAVRRKAPEPWVDWNVVEGRKRWEYGHAEPPPALWGD